MSENWQPRFTQFTDFVTNYQVCGFKPIAQVVITRPLVGAGKITPHLFAAVSAEVEPVGPTSPMPRAAILTTHYPEIHIIKLFGKPIDASNSSQ
jgi:hypothetical protein